MDVIIHTEVIKQGYKTPSQISFFEFKKIVIFSWEKPVKNNCLSALPQIVIVKKNYLPRLKFLCWTSNPSQNAVI